MTANDYTKTSLLVWITHFIWTSISRWPILVDKLSVIILKKKKGYAFILDLKLRS